VSAGCWTAWSSLKGAFAEPRVQGAIRPFTHRRQEIFRGGRPAFAKPVLRHLLAHRRYISSTCRSGHHKALFRQTRLFAPRHPGASQLKRANPVLFKACESRALCLPPISPGLTRQRAKPKNRRWTQNSLPPPEIRADVDYIYDFNHPKDNTISGSSEVFFRANEGPGNATRRRWRLSL